MKQWISLIFSLCFIKFIEAMLVNKIIMFQGYNSEIYHLYITVCVYHSQSHSLPSPYIWPLLSLRISSIPLFSLVTTTLLFVSMSLCLVREWLGTYRKLGTSKFLWRTDLEVYEGCWVFMTVAFLSFQWSNFCDSALPEFSRVNC